MTHDLSMELLELALDLDAWSGADQDHNPGDTRVMLENIRRRLGLSTDFGSWIVTQYERGDQVGVMARFLKEVADEDSLRRGGSRFPDVHHVHELLLTHGRENWAEMVLPVAQDEYAMRYERKLARLLDDYHADLMAAEEVEEWSP